MSVTQHFSDTYAQAREKFLAAASAAGGKQESYPHPLKGPDGGELAMDVALFGPRDAAKLLVMASGTHGIEGYCGSGIQIALLQNGILDGLADDTALLMVHAHNPHGFAWQRRVTEDNVDLNRNFQDFATVARNEGYADVHPMLVPADWDGPERAASEAEIAKFIEDNGMFAFQTAVFTGQYEFPGGLFFGGHKPTWSRQNMEKVALKYCSTADDVALLDLHTGLGPRGFGELIFIDKGFDDEWERAQVWYGDEAKSPTRGTSVSAPVTGTIDGAYRPAVGNSNFTGVAVEYGTIPSPEVLQALRADNWLHLHGDLESDLGKQIKREIRAGFFGEDEKWQQDVYDRGLDVTRKALAGLAG